MDYTNYVNNVNSNNNNNNGNINQAGYNRSFGYPSGSRTAESPLLSRFRQNHGYNSPTMSNGINRNYQSQERAEMFLNNNYFPSYSSGGSRPGSVMSNFSAISGTTNMSNVSELSVITDVSQFSTHMSGDSGGGHMYPNHNTYPPSSSFSSYERQSHASMLHPNEYLENLRKEIENAGLSCNDKLLEAKAQARTQIFEFVTKEVLTSFVLTLFNTMNEAFKTKNYKIVGNIIHIFHYLLHLNIQPPHRGRAKFAIINFIKQNENAIRLLLYILQADLGFEFKKMLINNINTVIHETKKNQLIKLWIQNHPNIVSTYLSFIQCDNKNIYSIAMDSLSRIMNRSDALKTQFMDQNGIELVLNIIANENQERILYRAAELLFCTLSTNNEKITTRFIKGHGIDICTRLLDHGSSRLLNKLMECIQYVCDKLSNTNFDATESFKHMIMLIGSQDHILESKVIGCLGNMISKSDRNKKLLCDLNVPTILLRAIVCFTDPTAPIYPKIKTDLLDNILFVLQGLTGTNVSPEIKNAAIHQIINYAERIWEKWFMYFIEFEQINIVNRALMIVYNILLQAQYTDFKSSVNISAFKKHVEIVFLRVYQAIKLLNPGDQQTLFRLWSESRLFDPNTKLNAEEYEMQQKPIKLLLSRSVKLLRVLINDNQAKHILAKRMLNEPNFPLNLLLGFTENPEVCDSMFAIAAALLHYEPGFFQIWQNKEFEVVIQHCYTLSQSNPVLQKSFTDFYNIYYCFAIGQQQEYLRQYPR